MKIDWMVWLRRSLSFSAFSFQYIIPILLFGKIVPYTRGELAAGLTIAGIIALCVLVLVVLKKFKESVVRWNRSLKRGIVLSVIEAIPMIIIALFLKWLAPAVSSILKYWFDIIPFFVIGRVLYCVSEILYEKERADK